MKRAFAVFALALAAGLSHVRAQTSAVKVDWILDGGYRTLQRTGSEPAFQTIVNGGEGLYLTRLSLLAYRPNGRIDEFRIDLSGFGAGPSGAADVSLTKYKWYRMDFRRHEMDSHFTAPELALGQHGRDTHLTDSGAALTLFPVGPVRLNLGYDQNRYDGNFGTTFPTIADQFALKGSMQRKSEAFRVGATGTRGPMHAELNYLGRKYTGRETTYLPEGSQAGNHPDDLAVLKAFSSVRPVEGNSDRTSGVIQWLKGPLQLRAQYIRLNASQHATADRSDSETTTGGARKEISQFSDSRAGRDVDYGKLLARWKVARPLAIKLTFWSGKDVTEGSEYLHRTGVSVGVPIVVDSNSLTRASVTQREGTVAVEFGRFGPLSFDLAGGAYRRSIGTDGRTSSGTFESADQTGNLLRGGILWARNGWRIRAVEEGRTVDHPYTDAGARRLDRSDLDLRYKARNGFYAEGKGTRTRWDSRAGRRSADALTLSAGYDGPNLLVSGGYAWLDAESRVAVLGEEGDVPYDLADLWSDQSTYLDAEWSVAPFCRVELHANRYGTTGNFGCIASRIEPRLNLKFGNTWLRFGVYRDDYRETTPEGRSFRSDGITVGAAILP